MDKKIENFVLVQYLFKQENKNASYLNLIFILSLFIFFTCKRELTSISKESDEPLVEEHKENFAILGLSFREESVILVSDLTHVEVAQPGGKSPVIHAVAPADLKIYTSDIFVVTDKTVNSRVEPVINSNNQTRIFHIVLSSRIQNLVSVKYELHINAPSMAVETKLLEIRHNGGEVYFNKDPSTLQNSETLIIEFMDPTMQNNYRPIFSENAQVFVTEMVSLDHCSRKKYNVVSQTQSEASMYFIDACTAPILKNIEINEHIYRSILIKDEYTKERELTFRVKNRPKSVTDLKLKYSAAVPIEEIKDVQEVTDHYINYVVDLSSIYQQKILYKLKTYTEIQFFVEDISLENHQISNALVTHQGGDFCTNLQGILQKEQIKIKEIEGLTYELSVGNTPNQWILKIENGLDEPKHFTLNFYPDQPNISTYKIEDKNNILWKKQENLNPDFDYQEQTIFEDWIFTSISSPKCLQLKSIKYPELGDFQVFDNNQGWIKTKHQDANIPYRQWLEIVNCGETYHYCIDFQPIDLILEDIQLSDAQALWKIGQEVISQLDVASVDKIWREQLANVISEDASLQINLKTLNNKRNIVTQKITQTAKGKKISLETRFANPPQIDFSIFSAIPIEIWEDLRLLDTWPKQKFVMLNDLSQDNLMTDFVIATEFQGELNGNLKTITWKMTGTASATSLFKKLNTAKISNLLIKNLTLKAQDQAAPLALVAENSVFESIRLENIVLKTTHGAGFIYSFLGKNTLKNIHIFNLTVEQSTLFAGLAVDVKQNAEINLEKISIHELSTQSLSGNSFVAGLFHNSANTSYKVDGNIISLKSKASENFGAYNRGIALFDQKQGTTKLSDVAIDLNINTNGFLLINSVKDASTILTDLVIYQTFTNTPKFIGNANQTTAKIIYRVNNTPKRMDYVSGDINGLETTITKNEDYQLNSSIWQFKVFPNLPVLKSF